MKQADSVNLVIFGASGDLTQRKLMPALFELHKSGSLPKQTRIIGFARSQMSRQQFQDEIKQAMQRHCRSGSPDAEELGRFLQMLHYQTGAYDDHASYSELAGLLHSLDGDSPSNRLYYLAIPPDMFSVVVAALGATGQAGKPSDGKPWVRVIHEKPFGRDLRSARQLNQEILSVLDERQVYRIDHYLGKETVQNIMAFRFGNSIFEPLWNRRYVDHVQVTAAETVAVGRRAGYYDQSGAVRDMVQNHILQLVALVAMEPPASFSAEAVRDEKVKVLRSIRPIGSGEVGTQTVRGQYRAGQAGGVSVPDYCSEEGVAEGSQTETYVALKLHLDNWRWSGVPFYIRTGKALTERITEITIQFRQPPLALFGNPSATGDAHCGFGQPNTLSLQVQPDESIRLQFGLKIPGSRMELKPNDMEFRYREVFGKEPPEAYERLILDALLGDRTLFIRHDEVEAAWTFVDAVLAAWQGDGAPPVAGYPAGSWGPPQADELLARDGCCWSGFKA